MPSDPVQDLGQDALVLFRITDVIFDDADGELIVSSAVAFVSTYFSPYVTSWIVTVSDTSCACAITVAFTGATIIPSESPSPSAVAIANDAEKPRRNLLLIV